jgi:hypothetical protein
MPEKQAALGKGVCASVRTCEAQGKQHLWQKGHTAFLSASAGVTPENRTLHASQYSSLGDFGPQIIGLFYMRLFER